MTELEHHIGPKRRSHIGRTGRHIAIDEAAARATLFRVLARAYSYPDVELIQAVRTGFGQLLAADAETFSAQVNAALKRAASAWRATSGDVLREEFSRLFIGSGPVRLREGCYGDGLRFAGQPTDLADLSGFYIAFGFGPPPGAASPPDHLGTELEFVSLMYLKLASALERRNAEQVEVTQRALAAFLRDHLGRWSDALCSSLRDSGADAAYRALGELTRIAVAQACFTFGVKPESANSGAALDPVQEDALICPLAEPAPTSAAERLS